MANILATTNYHRFWSPVSGMVVAVEQLGGLYVTYGTDAAVGDHRRAYVIYETPRFGLVAMIMVGMYDISSILLDVKAGDNVSNCVEIKILRRVRAMLGSGRRSRDPSISPI